MDIYTALFDVPGKKSELIGSFSTEPKAWDACQEHYLETTRYDEVCAPFGDLPWDGDRATLDDGAEYVVVMLTLDVPTGQG